MKPDPFLPDPFYPFYADHKEHQRWLDEHCINTGEKMTQPKKKQPLPGCSICDGTGLTCNICGESRRSCQCEDFEIEEYEEQYGPPQFQECEACTK